MDQTRRIAPNVSFLSRQSAPTRVSSLVRYIRSRCAKTRLFSAVEGAEDDGRQNEYDRSGFGISNERKRFVGSVLVRRVPRKRDLSISPRARSARLPFLFPPDFGAAIPDATCFHVVHLPVALGFARFFPMPDRFAPISFSVLETLFSLSLLNNGDVTGANRRSNANSEGLAKGRSKKR